MTELTRRQVLRAFGVTAGASALAACGVKGQGVAPIQGGASADSFWAGQQRTSQLNFANWPLYVDVGDDKDRHPSLREFTAETGIAVKYDEIKTGDEQIFSKFQPALSASQYCGYDLVTIANSIWFPRWKELGYLTPLDHDRMPNFTKYAGEAFRSPSYDPGNQFQVPWQNGFTGIAYDPRRTGREITSWEDLTDPAFRGKIGMMADVSELPNVALLAVGVDPVQSTEADWRRAAKWLQDQKPLVRKYYTQDYIDALAKGDIWIGMGWSGDIFQQNLSGSDLRFVMPKEGTLLWTDCLVIPRGARNAVAAMELIDHYYHPDNAAQVAEYVNYICPVPDAKRVVLEHASAASGDQAAYLRDVAESYAVFPGPDDFAKARGYRPLTSDEFKTWASIFEPVYQA